MSWCSECKSYTSSGHVHVAEGSHLTRVYNNNRRSYPVNLNVRVPRSFGEGFGGVVGVAAGLIVAGWLYDVWRRS